MEQMILSMLAIGTFDPQRWKKKQETKTFRIGRNLACLLISIDKFCWLLELLYFIFPYLGLSQYQYGTIFLQFS